MLDRHKARLCSGCSAPMAQQSQRCWRCHADCSKPPERPRRSLEESTAHVLSARARRHADDVRRDRTVLTRATMRRSPTISA
jgi:predicted amidophosphoribosyltransferase